jgi:hypothetical protein
VNYQHKRLESDWCLRFTVRVVKLPAAQADLQAAEASLTGGLPRRWSSHPAMTPGGWSRLPYLTLGAWTAAGVRLNFNDVVVKLAQNFASARQQTPHHTMSSEEPTNPMAESGVTVRSDSEQYSGAEEVSMSPPSSGSPAMILYQPPTLWGLIRGAAINLLLPFINGMMLGFGELFAHEAAFRLGWGGTRVCACSIALRACAVQFLSSGTRSKGTYV